MLDQAESLRKLVDSEKEKLDNKGKSPTKIITVTSGKGGVGKSNFVAVSYTHLRKNH